MIIGFIVVIVLFVCLIGNVLFVVVLWNGGISFGGVIVFIFVDLLILLILNIYCKYYGVRMMLVLFGIFYVLMVVVGYFIEFFFGIMNFILS